jgi:hypothetical protein
VKWFRFYHDAIDDPKVQRLSGDLFKFWVNMLCLGSRSNDRGVVKLSTGEIAFALRLDDDVAEAMLTDLVKRNLLEETTDGIAIHNWNSREVRSDSSAERVAKHRSNADSNNGNGECNVTFTVTETVKPSVNTDYRDTDTDTDTDTEEVGGANAPGIPPKPDDPPEKPKTKRATRIPDDFEITDDMRRWAIEQGAGAIQVERETEKFRDYWQAAAGSKGVKLDWSATWRNWIRRGIEDGPRGNGSLTVHQGGRNGAPGPDGRTDAERGYRLDPGPKGWTADELARMSMDDYRTERSGT